MQKSEYIKFLIPVVAALVIIESVVVLTSFTNKKTELLPKNDVNEVASGVDKAVVSPTKEQPQAELVFEVGTKAMKLGQQYPVSLNMTVKKDFQIDSFDVYIKYDPTAFEVTNQTFDKKLGKPTFAKISTDKSMLVANIYLSDPKGLAVLANKDILKLMGFTVKAKKVGPAYFEVNTGNVRGESATMMVENGTAKVIPFSSNKLEVNVTK